MCCVEYVCAVLCVGVRCRASMSVNLPQGLYLAATQKKRERVTNGEITKKTVRDQMGLGTRASVR